MEDLENASIVVKSGIDIMIDIQMGEQPRRVPIRRTRRKFTFPDDPADNPPVYTPEPLDVPEPNAVPEPEPSPEPEPEPDAVPEPEPQHVPNTPEKVPA